MKKYNCLSIAVFVTALFALCLPVSAHHGVAAYDASRPVTVKGIVTDFRFINPHAVIYVNSQDPRGQTKTWEIELNGANMLTRSGWAPSTIKVGDEITLVGFRSKKRSGSLRPSKIVASDGTELLHAGATLDSDPRC
jgi:hypothetical protein